MININLSEKEILALRIAISDEDACFVCGTMSFLDDEECCECWYENTIISLRDKLNKL